MKIKSQLFFLITAMVLAAAFTSCGSAHGGRNCDCPKFGETNTQQDIPSDQPSS